jgi:hypothetical protein
VENPTAYSSLNSHQCLRQFVVQSLQLVLGNGYELDIGLPTRVINGRAASPDFWDGRAKSGCRWTGRNVRNSGHARVWTQRREPARRKNIRAPPDQERPPASR